MTKAKTVKTTKDKVIAIATSYLRAAFAATLALYMAGITDPKVLANGFAAAIIAPLLKALDPKSTDFGKNSK